MAMVLLSACTHVPAPKLSDEEKTAAEAELSQWPKGAKVLIPSNDGQILKARLYRPPGKIRATMVAMHGMETHSRWFALLASQLSHRGIAVLAMDRRGSGMNREIGAKGQLEPPQTYKIWLQDILAHTEYARRFGGDVYIMGNSWGGNPVLAWAETKEAGQWAKGIVLLTPGLASHKPSLPQLMEIGLSHDDALLGTCLSVKDYSQRRSTWALLEMDPNLTKEVSAYFLRQSGTMRTNTMNHLENVHLPTLLICAGDDKLMENKVMKQKLNQGLRHGLYKEVELDGDFHLALIEDPGRVAAKIASWMASR
jgi:alpha-beta hydrolase superfamily lysophospholipase